MAYEVHDDVPGAAVTVFQPTWRLLRRGSIELVQWEIWSPLPCLPSWSGPGRTRASSAPPPVPCCRKNLRPADNVSSSNSMWASVRPTLLRPWPFHQNKQALSNRLRPISSRSGNEWGSVPTTQYAATDKPSGVMSVGTQRHLVHDLA